jgi:putative transposase
MARPLRIEFPGAVYHVTSRGNAKQPIFLDTGDYRSFFSILGDVSGSFGWQCYAYCLMPNHYHLVLSTPTGVLSRGMRQLNGVYAQRFHGRHDSVGHVFQGRFKSIHVDKEPYLLEVCRYVVLNPVRAGLVKKCEAWRWSSYKATLGLGPKPSFLASDWLLSQFGKAPGRARRAFAKFVADGARARSPWDNVRGGVFLGDEAFVSGFSKELSRRRGDPGFPGAQRLADRPSLHDILTETDNEILRGQQVLQAQRRWGYRIKDISEHLCMHRNTVAGIARRAAMREEDAGQEPGS